MTHRKLDNRLYFLLIAAAVIAGLYAFKATRTYPPRQATSTRSISEPAPPFELYDQSTPSRLVRLVAFLGRQRVLVVFFDGRAGADRSPVLNRLRGDAAKLRKAEVYILAISAALPQENRKIIAAQGPFPFPLLSDPGFDVQRAWGRFDETNHKTREGVFLIDRKGEVAWSQASNRPLAVDDWEQLINELAAGE